MKFIKKAMSAVIMEKSAQSICEFESKFACTSTSEECLRTLGGRRVESLTLSDTYYDTNDYNLCLNNYWLRTRNDIWELKYSPWLTNVNPGPAKSHVTKYLEESNPAVIKKLIFNLFLQKGFLDFAERFADDGSSLDHCVSSAAMGPFALIKTFRTSYVYDDVTVHLDRTEDGYTVGEVEIISETNEGSGSIEDSAKTKIEEFGKKLGVEWTKVPGKLETYLMKNNCKLYDDLTAAGVL